MARDGVSVADEEVLRLLEERLAMPAADESREALGELLAAGFREFGSSGRIYDATSVLETRVPGGRPKIILDDFKAAAVADGVVLVTYVSRSVSGPGWKPPALRSSLWRWRHGRWQLLFHQGTRLPSEGAA